MPVVQVNKIVCQKADLTKQQTITNYGELWRWRIRMSKVASVLDRAAAIRKLEATLPKFQLYKDMQLSEITIEYY